MKELVRTFPKQLAEASGIASRAILSEPRPVSNVLISGLGGSGIGGSILTELVNHSCPVPILINKDYHLPAFVNSSTLLIISSYSGNTEETLSAMQQGMRQKARIVCISSGGKVLELAKQHQFDFIEIPGGFPPRSCLGYSLVQLIKILVHYGLAGASLFNDLEKCIQLLSSESDSIISEARNVAAKLLHKLPVIYSLGSCEGTAVRFRQQINENSKMLCWHHSFPEMNHNELVGWTERHENIAVLTFRTSFDYERTVKRYEICKPIFEKYASSVTDLQAKGESRLEQFLYLVHLGDWISCFIAELKGIDPVEVNVITRLKDELAKF
ncbi:MAG TPA: bifunctional phosphoglucose/phosphomannose isomerase [Bacteroidia bacterium]|nr:bifunctional phosphoglucose/phosphomannose isomerase [Bacteroidia bacterium]